MRFFEQPAVLIEAGRTEVVSRILMRCVAALGSLDELLLQCETFVSECLPGVH